LVRGDRVKEFAFTVPSMIYRGVFSDGEAYQRGDMVTWGGSLWHCDAPTVDKPLDASKSWTLAAKRGRDGKDGRNGDPGERGPAGERGRDLTQMSVDGTKW
jgi:integrin beta 3